MIEKKCAAKALLETNDYHNASGGDTYLNLIRTNEAWDITTGDERILIGCTDTYLNENHEDLTNKIEQVLNNVYDPNSNIEYHGTPVAGCLVAETNNGVGAASVSYQSKLVFSDNWGNDNEVLQIAQIPGVRVINLSWGSCNGFNTFDQALYEEIRDIHGVIIVAGAGNGWSTCSTGPTTPFYPAMYESVIGVTSVGHSYERGTTQPGLGEFLWKDCHQWQIGNDSTHHHNELVNISATGYNAYSTSWGSNVNNDEYGGT